jgi:hypothetical protein
MKNLERFAWAIAVIIALGLGIYAGHRVTAAYGVNPTGRPSKGD